jgi:hypothetical protein
LANARNSTVNKPNIVYIDDRIGAFSPFERDLQILYDEKNIEDNLDLPQHDDDMSYNPALKDYFRIRSIISALGAMLLIAGLLLLFIVLPVLTYTGFASFGGLGYRRHHNPHIHPADWVTDAEYPLLKNIRTSLIDPATPSHAMTRPGMDGDTLQLVYSDEFNTPNRTFYPGDDPYWTAPDLWYGATQDLDWYDPDAVTTFGGTLILRLDQFQNHNLKYRSGMLNSWNQICLKGGALEVSLSLAGLVTFTKIAYGAYLY